MLSTGAAARYIRSARRVENERAFEMSHATPAQRGDLIDNLVEGRADKVDELQFEERAALHRKLRGHYAYYGINGNGRSLSCFLHEVRRLWRKWLHCRSWQTWMAWEKFIRLTARYPLPQPRVVHRIYRRVATP